MLDDLKNLFREDFRVKKLSNKQPSKDNVKNSFDMETR